MQTTHGNERTSLAIAEERPTDCEVVIYRNNPADLQIVFNKNIVQDFDFQASSFGAHYGGATGGIFDVKLRDPRQQNIKFTLDASLIKAGSLFIG